MLAQFPIGRDRLRDPRWRGAGKPECEFVELEIQPVDLARHAIALVGAFKRDGVPCEIDWLYLQLDEFTLRLASAAPTGVAESVAADWELREHSDRKDVGEGTESVTGG